MKSKQPFRPLAGLRDLIFHDFSVGNLHDLALDFNLDYDELEGNSKGRRVVTLIEIMVRNGIIIEFIERCQELRPRANFQPFLEAARKNPQAFELKSSEYENASPETAVYQALNKALGLIEAQSRKIEQMTRPRDQVNQYASEQTRVSKDSATQTNKSWGKDNIIGNSISSSIASPNNVSRKSVPEVTKTLRGGRLHGEIEQLEAQIAEDIEGLLTGIREKMEALKEKLNEHQQLMQDESTRSTKSSLGFQGKAKASFPVGKSPFARK